MTTELVSLVDRYLIGQRTRREVEGWLASHTRLIHQSSDRRAMELANQLEADLIEFGEGLLDETGLVDRWNSLLSHFSTVFFDAKNHKQTLTSTGSITIRSIYDPESDITLWLTHQFAA